MNHRRRRLVVAALTIGALHAAQAQKRGAASCSPEVYNDANPGQDAGDLARMHPLVSRSRYATLVENERWQDAMRALREDAAGSFVAAGVSEQDRNTFFSEVDDVIGALAGLPKKDDPAGRTMSTRPCNRSASSRRAAFWRTRCSKRGIRSLLVISLFRKRVRSAGRR